MTNRIILIENADWMGLNAAEQFHLENSLNRIIGARLFREPNLLKHIASPNLVDAVIACPILIPEAGDKVDQLLKEIERHFPISAIFGIVFMLVPSPSFLPAALTESIWMERLDRFYDQAIPCHFVVLHGGSVEVQEFHFDARAAAGRDGPA